MSKKSDDNQPKPQDAAAARERQRLIGRRLQSFFDDTIQEGVPDEFSKLLDQLDEAEQKRSETSQGEADAEPQTGRSGGSR
ncbi:MAG: NepR family anti-sigma factor [Oceanicaulis sp.]